MVLEDEVEKGIPKQGIVEASALYVNQNQFGNKFPPNHNYNGSSKPIGLGQNIQ